MLHDFSFVEFSENVNKPIDNISAVIFDRNNSGEYNWCPKGIRHESSVYMGLG